MINMYRVAIEQRNKHFIFVLGIIQVQFYKCLRSNQHRKYTTVKWFFIIIKYILKNILLN